jgi:hypothetical protein
MVVKLSERGAVVFEETMMPSFMPGGIDSYKRNLAMTWYLRGTAALCITLFALIDGPYEPVLIFCLIIGIFGIVLLFLLSEVVYYTNQVLSAMPLRVLENGLIIPPLYIRQYTKKGGYISKEEIDRIVVVRHKVFRIGNSKKEMYWYDNAPVEFIVYLKDGKKRRSGPRPPGTIRVVVDTMHDTWGTKIEQKGSGNGTLSRIVNHKTVEIREL